MTGLLEVFAFAGLLCGGMGFVGWLFDDVLRDLLPEEEECD